MPPKKKQSLCASVAEQQQLLEGFYNDLDDGTFLGHEFGEEGEDESNISCSSSDIDIDVSDKDTDCTSQPVDEEELVPRSRAKQVTDSLEAYSLFFIDNMFRAIVEYTNLNIQNFGRKFENVMIN